MALSDSARKAPFAPETFSPRRIGMQAMGLALLVAAILLALALATYARTDPSWDHAADGAVANALGLAGARFADALLQGLGLGAWLLPLVLLDWAVRLLLGRWLARLWLKLVLLLVNSLPVINLLQLLGQTTKQKTWKASTTP